MLISLYSFIPLICFYVIWCYIDILEMTLSYMFNLLIVCYYVLETLLTTLMLLACSLNVDIVLNIENDTLMVQVFLVASLFVL